MVRYFILGLLRLAATALGLLTLLFLLTRLLPDEQQLLARFGEMPSGASPTAEQVQAALQQTRLRLGLAEPAFYFSMVPAPTGSQGMGLTNRWQWNGTANQYHHWLVSLLQGSLGNSYRTGEPVAPLIGNALQYTLPLTGLAAVLIGCLSVPLGLWMAPRQQGWAVATLFTLDALPLYVVALLLLLFFASPDFLTLFPAYGLSAEDSSGLSWFSQPAFWVLPLASLILAGLPEPALQLTAALRREAAQDYILTARAKGLSRPQAFRKHALRNALLPSLTLFTELVPSLLAGAVVVELIFALPGLGRLLAEAATARDYPVLLGGIAVTIVVRLVSLAAAEALYRWADPRLRTPLP